MTTEELESQFLSVASLLSAEAGSANYYCGQVDGTPFLMKLVSVDPPAYMFKLRMTEPHNLHSDWPSTLSEEYVDANVDCEIEGDYIFLWIRDSIALNAEKVAALVRSCIDHHSSYFPEAAGYCFDCGELGNASVIQSSASITSICESCLDKRSEARRLENDRLNESSGSLTFLVPVAVTVSAFGWAIFWWLYDAAFIAVHAERIWAPRILILAVVLGVGFGLGWPVGKLLHRSGLVKRLSPAGLSIAATILAVAIGELLFASYIVLRATGSIDFSLILQNTLPIAFGGNIMYALLKIGFAITFCAAVYHIAKPKEAKLTL